VTSYKRLFARALAGAPGRLHFAAHSHHLWPDASYRAHMQAWEDGAGLADEKWAKIYERVIPEAQAHIARELNLPDPATIALAPNTHELVVRLFSARERRQAPLLVVSSDGEFHSFRRQLARWQEEGIAQAHLVTCEPFDSFSARYVAAVARLKPDIAFVSHVMFQSGLMFTGLAELAALADRAGTWAVVDGYHAFMAVPVDLGAVADRIFYVAGGYKYAMAGEGAAFMHAPAGFAPRPVDTGWFAEFSAIEERTPGAPYPQSGARFLGATFDPTGLYRFNAVRDMLAAEGLDTGAVCARTEALRGQLVAAIAAGDAGRLGEAKMLATNAVGPKARFIALRDARAQQWTAALQNQNVIVDARDDVLRIGLGLYHDADDVVEFCRRARRAAV